MSAQPGIARADRHCGSWRPYDRQAPVAYQPRAVCTRPHHPDSPYHWNARRTAWWHNEDLTAHHTAEDPMPTTSDNPTTPGNDTTHAHTMTAPGTLAPAVETRTTLLGSSDDLIRLDGPLSEEFPYNDQRDHPGDLVAFSDGTILRIRRDHNGVWRITPVRIGPSMVGITHAVEDDDQDRTDRAYLVSVSWAVHGTGFVSTR